MAVEVVMPKFGLTMLEGTIQRWFKAEGEEIKAGEPLFEVETEKILYEVEAPANGTVARLLFNVEATVPVGQAIAVIAEPGEDVAEVAASYQGAPAVAATAAAPAPAAQPAGAGGRRPEAGGGERKPITPAARRLAEEHGIDVPRLTGTGPSGRITREDVQTAIEAKAQQPFSPTPTAAPQPSPTAETIPVRGMRKVIAERMHKSLQGSAQLTITTEVDVTQLIDRRQEVQREFSATYTDFIIQACAHALRLHPRMNSALDGETIHVLPDVHVGMAVALDEGLIVPVIRHVDQKPLFEIAQESSALAEKARAGRLALEEVSGGTFTVSNLGMYGVDGFTPILNSPQSGILGVGRIVEKPVVYRGEITKRAMMVLSLTFDHRVIDGAPAGAFLQTVADLLAHGNRVSLNIKG